MWYGFFLLAIVIGAPLVLALTVGLWAGVVGLLVTLAGIGLMAVILPSLVPPPDNSSHV
jgi:hypothetical protein